MWPRYHVYANFQSKTPVPWKYKLWESVQNARTNNSNNNRPTTHTKKIQTMRKREKIYISQVLPTVDRQWTDSRSRVGRDGRLSVDCRLQRKVHTIRLDKLWHIAQFSKQLATQRWLTFLLQLPSWGVAPRNAIWATCNDLSRESLGLRAGVGGRSDSQRKTCRSRSRRGVIGLADFEILHLSFLLRRAPWLNLFVIWLLQRTKQHAPITGGNGPTRLLNVNTQPRKPILSLDTFR